MVYDGRFGSRGFPRLTDATDLSCRMQTKEGQMRSRAMMIVAVGGLLLAAPLFAQTPQQRPMMQMDGMMGMMGTQASPQMILRMRETLELTDEQVQRIEAIQGEMQKAHQPHMHAAMQAMQEAQRLLDPDSPDWDRYEAQLREATDHHVQAHVAMARASVDARNVLTAEQRERLGTGMKMMQGGMPGMMERMGPGMMPQGQNPTEHPPRP